MSDPHSDPMVIRLRLPVEGHADYCCYFKGWTMIMDPYTEDPTGHITVQTTPRATNAMRWHGMDPMLDTLRSLHHAGYMAFLAPYSTEATK